MQAAAPPDGSADWLAPAATEPVSACMRPPGSKSVTNRALILAALGTGPTTITGPLRARDTELMAGALRALGASIDETGSGGEPGSNGETRSDGEAEAWQVTPGQPGGPAVVDVGNAGTVLRFVPPAAALARADVEFRGDARASKRPVGPLLAALRELGAVIDDGGRGAIPFIVRGRGAVSGGTVTLDASGSSQLVSGLLLAAPRYDKGAEVCHRGPRVPSAPHIAMTVQMLRDAGANVEAWNAGHESAVPDRWRVHPGELRPRALAVEPDLSNAAPFLAAALVTAGSVTITDWPARTLQPAGQILDVLTQMGAHCEQVSEGMRVTGSGRIHGIAASLGDVSEIVPVLTALAALADSPSAFTGIGHMRTHETDRLAALAAEIGSLGGDVAEREDGLVIRPRPLRAGGGAFATYDDHRLVMAAAVLGLALPGGLRVGNAATVGKTFPGFTRMWSGMLERSP
ncbi:MAG TPA: 3-phosphoshikimate 1-carboxyvinyltransferase [Streptosporangiaceae bacterium]|nr:3-phosphoshikimate 1-carboxyvinyltransferase [Streptosporangiaceae bacterium]